MPLLPLGRRATVAAVAAVVAIGVAIALIVVFTSGGTKHEAALRPTPTPSQTTTAPPAPPTCPLTGLPAADGRDPHRVALAVKIDNLDFVRPQAGVDHADVVVEELVEGGLTRLFAVFQCDGASSVGPIRSARPVDADLLALLNGSVFGYSGANPRAIVPVRQHGNAVLISNDDLPQYFHRSSSRPAPHNVYSSTDLILRGGLQRRHGLKAPRPMFTYDDAKPSGRSVRRVSMTWPAASAAWTWNGTTWLRTQGGSRDYAADGRRINAANVIVMSITTRASGIRDVAGNETPDDVITGRGPVWVFRDGRVIAGHWSRPTWRNRMRLLDAAGKVIPLHPGKTWIELLPKPRRPRIR